MNNVVCLKHGNKYSADYVNKLYSSVKRNTTVPITFHCFTDDNTGIDSDIVVHPLPYTNVTGWWQKLYLFSDELPIDGQILFMDLDTLVVKNIDNYVTHRGGFTVLRDLWSGGINVGSAIMSFEAKRYPHIWDSFIRDPQSAIASLQPHGDQKWIQSQQPDRTYWQDLYPGGIVSFKSHCRRGIPQAGRIICFHGKPSIPEAINTTTNTQGFLIPPTPWVAEHWK